MLDLFRRIKGFYRVCIYGAAPERTLNRLTAAHVLFWDVERVDAFTYCVSVEKRKFEKLQTICARTQSQVELLGEIGLLCHFRGLKHRKAFVTAVVFILAIVFVLPNYIWCIGVEGNASIPDRMILRELETLGIGFGTWNHSIVPQELKNQMLNRIPQLEWLTINYNGGLATVLVREREPTPAVIDQNRVTNLIATQDCVIDDMEVLSGRAVCQLGETVQKGQILVSGYTDLEHCTQATLSLGEIYGRTWRQQNAVLPAKYGSKVYTGQHQVRYSILAGKKRINLFGNGGIWGDGCDKIISYHQLTLPGGYAFPITLIAETAIDRGIVQADMGMMNAETILKEGTAATVKAQMVAGKIVKDNLKTQKKGDLYLLSGTYECREMVARSVPAILFESEGIP